MEQNSQVKRKRLEKEEKIAALKLKKFPDFLLLQPIIDDQGGKVYDQWQFKFKGKQGTPLEGGFYDVIIEFGSDYPKEPPKAKFVNGFVHMHVYLSGDICLPLIQSHYYSMGLTVFQIAQNIYEMVHGVPNPSDKANQQMETLYNQSKEAYYQKLKDQASKFKQYENYLCRPLTYRF
ncbi:Ubiquitin-conjugating enzyme/RWD-like protein [Pseudocohnilembus persalinus]|uniref:Ubiquitin-conjugating enzyme/RWD-like protein n=1 Tax=Pseudocohnilembus persalinus TaxID=266149 RepID=A0A0V0R2B9_PSEPJ|nr:Ubiquitin-conjugating enzyme/RWD-like protein [Pseudocohnilembus persalinus]|eukprot:KRX08416.1 Ubiquitin-conjugating enzyme/RWD-like protein [Pseudocohnilembus persalinus]